MNINMDTSVEMPVSISRSNSQQLEWALIDALSTIPSWSPPNSFTSGHTPRCLFPSLDTVMEAGVPCFRNANDGNGQQGPPALQSSSGTVPGQAQSWTNNHREWHPVDALVSPASNSIGHAIPPSFDGFGPRVKTSTIEKRSTKSAASAIGVCSHFGGMLRIGASTDWNTNTTGIPSLENGKGRRWSSPRWRCQAEGCNRDVSCASKVHYRRHKLCDSCAKSDSMIVKGGEVRFCQQCSSLHPLSEFDGYKRSCRRKLEKHLQLVRRRRAARKADAAQDVAAGGSRMEE